MWRDMQAEDLTAWLNSILVDTGMEAAANGERIAESAIFRNQVKAMCDLYKDADVNVVLRKIDAEVQSGRFFVSRKVSFATHFNSREQLIELLLLNYHPMWLLLALCAVLSCNFGVELGSAFGHLDKGANLVDRDRVFMSVLESIMQGKVLSSEGHNLDASPARENANVHSSQRDQFNAFVLKRVLHLVFLLDRAKQSRAPVLRTDPPLFRIGSNISSSQEVIEQLAKDFLPDHGDVIRFLTFRGYRLTYVTPLFERDSLVIKNPRKDLCDGVRLCKVASILTKDRNILSRIRRVRNGTSRREIFSSHLGNVSLAMSKIEEYAKCHLEHAFEWKGTKQDVVNGDLDKIIDILWQISGLWLQTNVLNKTDLANELSVVQQEFREAKQQSQVSVWSPGGSASIPDLTHRVVSPSRLTVYENCETECGLLLLKWCATVAGMYGIAVRDFTESFRDGAPLCVILHHYCPELIKAGEFIRVQQAELRSVNDSEAESEIVQKNFDLFTSRVCQLGAIPHIPIRAEAALAPPFTSNGKDASFGRVMELLSSYLFKRLTLEREGQTDDTSLNDFLLSERLPQEGFRTVPNLALNYENKKQMGLALPDDTDHTSTAARHTSLDSSSQVLVECRKTEKVDLLLGDTISGAGETDGNMYDKKKWANGSDNDGGSGSSVYVDAFGEESSEEALAENISDSNMLDKIGAGKLIFQYYRAAKFRRMLKERREAAVLIQACARAYIVQKKASRHHVLGTSILDQDESRDESRCRFQGEFKVEYTQIEPMVPMITAVKNMSINNTCLVPICTSKKALDQTIVMLPALQAHLDRIQAFASRMVSCERNQAALLIQRCYRARIGAESAVLTSFEQSHRNVSTNPWSHLRLGVFGVVRSVAHQFFVEAEMQRKASVTAVTNALYRAEQAYQMEMRTSANRSKQLNEGVQRRQNEQVQMRKKFSEEERWEDEELKREIQQLNDQMAVLEEHLLDRKEKAEEAEKVKASPSALSLLNPSTSEAPSKECLGSSNSKGMNNQYESELSDIKAFQSEIEELRQKENSMIEEMEKVQVEWTSIFEAQTEELRKWRGIVLVAAHHIAEYAFIVHMENLHEISSERYLKKMAFESNLSLLLKEEEQMIFTESSDMAQLDLIVSGSEKLYVQEERWMLEQIRRVFCKVSDVCAVVEKLYDVEEKEETEDFWRAMVESFELDVDNCMQERMNYDAWCREADLQDKALDDEIDRLQREEERVAKAKRLEAALHLAEEKYLTVMHTANAALEKDRRQRAEKLAELSLIANDEEVLRQQFDESLTSLSRALDGLDLVMEERGKYVQSLATPTRNPIASSPVLSNVPLTAMKSSPSTETRPLRELSTNIARALEFIDEQTSANTDENEKLYEVTDDREGTQLTSPLFPCDDRCATVENFNCNATQPHSNGQSDCKDNAKRVSSVCISSENCPSALVQEKELREDRDVANEGKNRLTMPNSLQRHVMISRESRFRFSSKSADDKDSFSIGSLLESPLLHIAANTAEVGIDGEEATEFRKARDIDRAPSLDDAQAVIEQPTIEKCGQNESSPSCDSASSVHGTNVECASEFGDNEPYNSSVATNSQITVTVHSESGQSVESDPVQSAHSTPSSWTNETMRGSPLPLENSPEWTNNMGSPLTSKRSSLRNTSGQTVLASLENRIAIREDTAPWKTPDTSGSKRTAPRLSLRSSPLDAQYLPAEIPNAASESENTPPLLLNEDSAHNVSNLIESSQPEISEPLKTPSADFSYSESFSALEMPAYLWSTPRSRFGLSRATAFTTSTNSISKTRENRLSFTNLVHIPADYSSDGDAVKESVSSVPFFGNSGCESMAEISQDKYSIAPTFSSTSAYISLERPDHTRTESERVAITGLGEETKEIISGSSDAIQLRRLSQELNEIQMKIGKNNSTMNFSQDMSQAKPLESILRRVSAASSKTASARPPLSNNMIDAGEAFSVLDIIRAICVIIRQCDRSEEHIEIVRLGTSIIRDLCRDEEHIESVILVEDCVGVIVNCVQFYRDSEEIIASAVEALLALSSHSYGEALLATHANFLERLRSVQSILQLQSSRDAVCSNRMRRANVILKAIENRRQNEGSKEFSTELTDADSMITAMIPEKRRSVKLLEALLGRFPIW